MTMARIKLPHRSDDEHSLKTYLFNANDLRNLTASSALVDSAVKAMHVDQDGRVLEVISREMRRVAFQGQGHLELSCGVLYAEAGLGEEYSPRIVARAVYQMLKEEIEREASSAYGDRELQDAYSEPSISHSDDFDSIRIVWGE